MILTGETCRLRPWQTGDEFSLQKNGDNFNIAKNMKDSFPHPYTLARAKDWIAYNQPFDNKTFAIEVNKQVVGGIGITLGTDVYRCSAEIGYWLGQPYWGKGIASEAIQLIVSYTFQHFSEIYRIFATIFEQNAASGRVLIKTGFSQEAIHPRCAIKNNQYQTIVFYTIFRDTSHKCKTIM